MTEWFEAGCEHCRQGMLAGRTDNPAVVSTNIAAHAHLRHCKFCGSFWEENEREAHVIDEAQARALFPMHFER